MPANSRPSFVKHDGADVLLRHAEHPSELPERVGAGSVQSSDLGDLRSSQFRARVRFSTMDNLTARPSRMPVPSEGPTFGDHVRHVVGGRAEEKVVGTTADRVVAVVANHEPVGDRTVRVRPSEAVRQPVLSLPNDLTIAVGSATACPKPAIVGSFNSTPEVLFKVGRFWRHPNTEFYQLGAV